MAALANGLMSPMTVSRIGRYEIKSLIGAGGMATCYLARDSNPKISRLVAIKVLNASIDSPDLRERFARESRALAALSHSNIVDIYDSGEFQGAPYIVMEYIRGETVAEKIKRRAPLTVGEKLKMMTELCEGLAHAHEAGIIHRDIKPANLMVDQRRCLKILDFGIARVAEGSMTRASVQVTQFNMRIGTPGYMSPEQIEGDEIDRRSDIFAVGAVFYELLSYREAFSGNSTRQIENKVLQAAPAPLVSLIPDLDPEIAAIVTRALDKDPNKRFQDAESFAQALEHQRWRLGPAARTPPPSRSTPPPTPTPGARDARDSRAEIVYQRSIAVYQDGAVDAARRFAIEALAEDPNHLGARALLEKIDPSSWSATSAFLAATSAAVDPTAISSDTFDEPTVVRTGARPVAGTGEPFWRKFNGRDLLRDRRVFWAAAAAAALVVIALLGVVIVRLINGPAGHELTITKPTGGSILGRGVSCGTLGSDCTVTRPDGEAVELQAQPDEGFLFAGYTGDCAAGGRTIMSEARTCGARFDPIPKAPPAAQLALTITPPKGGTIVAMGITCGTQHAECSASFAQGAEVKLDVLADAGYEFARYTGPCAPDGATVMTEPRTCSALFTRRVAEAAKPKPPVAMGGAPPRDPAPPSRAAEPPPSSLAGSGEAERLPDGVGPGGTKTATGSSQGPTLIAKNAIQKTLNAYRDANSRMDEDDIRRVFPAVTPGIREQLRQLKSVEFVFTGEPEYQDLNLPGGTATVVIGVKRADQPKVGRAQTLEGPATIKLRRLGPDSDHWIIDDVRYRK